MKKLFVSCMIAFMAICSVGAQEVYIGGGFTVGSENSEFVFQISPEVGCHLSFVTKVGFLGYSDSYNGTSDFAGVNFDTENISIGFHYNF